MLRRGSGLRALASRIVGAAVVAGAMSAGAPPAFAYRPFDGTDAAVMEPGKAGLNSSPLGVYRRVRRGFLVAPGVVINFGVVKGLELVFEGRLLETLSWSEPPNPTDAATFLKYVVRPSVLQDKSGHAAVRMANLNGRAVNELRAGLTFAFPLESAVPGRQMP